MRAACAFILIVWAVLFIGVVVAEVIGLLLAAFGAWVAIAIVYLVLLVLCFYTADQA
jgi:hypothetical protein